MYQYPLYSHSQHPSIQPNGLGARTLYLLVLLTLTHSVFAQHPRKTNTTYYDSLVNSQLHTSKAQPLAVDSALLKGDELIDLYYDESKPLPSSMWYGNNFSGSRVRQKCLPMDSLPDEINIVLVRKDNEFCFPVKNVRTSPYGWRWNRPHRGVDIALNTGDPVRCCFPGVVRIARPMGGYGNLVVVRHYNGLETVYGHLSKIKVKSKQVVKAGEVLGLGGSTGHSTGPHLHFEVRFQYETFDPEWILDFSNYTLRTHRLHLDKTYFGITAPRGRNPELAYKADKSFVKETPLKVRKQRKEVYCTTQRGDTYELLALRYSTTIDDIKQLNPDAPLKLKSGVKLRVR